jgi:hypothetical protein
MSLVTTDCNVDMAVKGKYAVPPKEVYEFRHKYMRPRGYRLKMQIVDFPEGMPGDIGITLSW